MGMKIKDGDVAATTVKTVSAIDFPSQLRYVQQLRDSHVQVALPYVTVHIGLTFIIKFSQHFCCFSCDIFFAISHRNILQ